MNGIKAVASAPFKLIKEIFMRIRRLLPFSDAAEGPLADLTRSGGSLAETFARGIAARAGAIQAAVQGALAAAQPTLPAFGFAGAGAGGAGGAASPTVRVGGGPRSITIDVSGAVEVVLDDVIRGLVTS